MAERPDQIEQHIASTRHQLQSNLHELEDKVKQAADWKTYYDRSPGTMLGLALAGGVMLAAMLGGSERKRAEIPYMPQPTRPKEAAERGSSNPIVDTWEHVKAALIGLSAAKIRSLLDDALPGFSEHYEKAARTKPDPAPASSYSQNREYEAPSHRM